MMIFHYFTRLYRIVGLSAIALSLSMGNAAARLPDVMSILTIRTVSAIHRPTGCVAKLEFSGTVLLGAAITDPLCLPEGGAVKAIPAFKRDFHLPEDERDLLRGQ